MVGSILSSILLVSSRRIPIRSFLTAIEILGSALFAAGRMEKEVEFNVKLSGVMSSLMIVSSAALVIPSASYFADVRSKRLETGEYILTLSHIASILLLIFYVLYLIFQLKTHADVFADWQADEDDGDPGLDPWAAAIVLILATLGVSVCSDSLVDSIDGFVEQLGVSRAFTGLILVPRGAMQASSLQPFIKCKRRRLTLLWG
jgi:Ca2+:H+ antiporter